MSDFEAFIALMCIYLMVLIFGTIIFTCDDVSRGRVTLADFLGNLFMSATFLIGIIGIIAFLADKAKTIVIWRAKGED